MGKGAVSFLALQNAQVKKEARGKSEDFQKQDKKKEGKKMKKER